MKILHVIPSVNLKGGGPIEWVRQVCPILSAQGHLCEVASLDAEDDPCVQQFPIKTYGLGPSKPEYRYSSRFIPWLRHNAENYDCVISHGIWQYSSLGVHSALKGSKIPYFVCVHGMLDPWFKRTYPLKHLKKIPYWLGAEYRVLRDAAAILYTCEEERRLARQSFWPYQGNETVTPLGTQNVEGNPASLRRVFLTEFPNLQDKRLLLYLSRIHVKKGCDMLIEAFAKVAPSDTSLRLVIAGPDQNGLQAGLQERATQLGIQDRIAWVGMLSGNLKIAAFQAAEVFILPSHQETFPVSATEATACGLPILTTYGVNTWREIQESGAGLIDNDDIEGITHLLQRWLAMSADEKVTMQQSARGCFAAHFEINNAARSLINVLRTNGVAEQATGNDSISLPMEAH